MSDKSGQQPPPPGYQSIPQPGGPAPSYPNEPPPKYEAPPGTGYQQAPPVSQGYPPQSQPIYVQQPAMVMPYERGFGADSRLIQCIHCQAQINTTVSFEPGALTWLSSGLLCIFGCWLGCCLIPFCINDLSDVQHKCPNCGKVVGVYRRLT